MYPRQVTAVDGTIFYAADMNALQDYVGGAMKPANGSSNAASSMPSSLDARLMVGPALLNATTRVIDGGSGGGIDWHDRILRVSWRDLGDSTRTPGSANDYLFDTVALTTVVGYTGKGAKGAAGAAVVNGTPPVPAAGSSWAIKLAANLWLYADPNSSPVAYRLGMYNNTGADLAAIMLWIEFSGQLGQRP